MSETEKERRKKSEYRMNLLYHKKKENGEDAEKQRVCVMIQNGLAQKKAMYAYAYILFSLTYA